LERHEILHTISALVPRVHYCTALRRFRVKLKLVVTCYLERLFTLARGREAIGPNRADPKRFYDGFGRNSLIGILMTSRQKT